jgi:hypothetical protein
MCCPLSYTPLTRIPVLCAGLQQRAEAAIPFMEKVGRGRANGAAVTVRTVTLMAGTAVVAFGLLGGIPLFPLISRNFETLQTPEFGFIPAKP